MCGEITLFLNCVVPENIHTPHPLPVTRHPLPVTRHPSPVTRHPSPVTRHPSPLTRHPLPATRGKVLPIPRDMPHCTLNERDIMYEKAKYIINIHVKHKYDGFLISKKIYDFSRNCVDFQQ